MLKLIKWNEFMDLAMKCKGVVCIGAGKRLTNMAQLPVTDEYLDSIKYIADNNKHKQGTLVEIGSQRLIVTSVEQLKGYNLKNMVILITVAEGYYDIVEQLKIMGVYDDIDIYLFSQSYDEIDKKFRELTTKLLMLTKSKIPFFVYATAIKKTMQLINGQIVQFFEIDKPNCFRFFIVNLWAYFNSYQSPKLPSKKNIKKYMKSDTL